MEKEIENKETGLKQILKPHCKANLFWSAHQWLLGKFNPANKWHVV